MYKLLGAKRIVTLQQLNAFWESEVETAGSTKDITDRMLNEGFSDEVPGAVRAEMLGWAQAEPGEEDAMFWDAAIAAMASAPNDEAHLRRTSASE